MARTKKTAATAEDVAKVEVEAATENAKETEAATVVTEESVVENVEAEVEKEAAPVFPTGKKPQRKHSLICNPKSKRFNAKVAKRRAKEKARRQAAKKNRSK